MMPFVPSTKVNTEGEVRLSFKIWILLLHASDHLNFLFFRVNAVMGDAMKTKPSTNYDIDLLDSRNY